MKEKAHAYETKSKNKESAKKVRTRTRRRCPSVFRRWTLEGMMVADALVVEFLLEWHSNRAVPLLIQWKRRTFDIP